MSWQRWVAAGSVFGGAGILGLIAWRMLSSGEHTLKDIKPDAPTTTPGKTGYKLVDKILDKLRAAAQASGIPLGLMVGWVAKESGGKLADTTSLDERGYFQLMPAESKQLGLDHQRLSTDSDYSIDAGVKLIRHYQSAVNDLNVTGAGTSYYWRLVKLAHSMGSGQLKKVVTAARMAGQAGSWDDLENFAEGMSISGPQPKKWFPFVDLVYSVGRPFGFGSEPTVVGHGGGGHGGHGHGGRGRRGGGGWYGPWVLYDVDDLDGAMDWLDDDDKTRLADAIIQQVREHGLDDNLGGLSLLGAEDM